jgi:hypothetical protein
LETLAITRVATFRQSDIDRAVRAIQRAGYRPRVTIRPGEVVVEALDSNATGRFDPDGPNEWDVLISRAKAL